MIMRQRAPLLVPGRGLPPLGGPAPLRTGAREGAMRARDMRPDQNLSADGHGHLRIQMINWRNTLAPATHFLLSVSTPMFFIPSLTPLRTVFGGSDAAVTRQCAERMLPKGPVHHRGYDEDVFPCVRCCSCRAWKSRERSQGMPDSCPNQKIFTNSVNGHQIFRLMEFPHWFL